MSTRPPRRNSPSGPPPLRNRAPRHTTASGPGPLATSNLQSRRLGPVAPGLRRLRLVQPRRCHRRRSRGQPKALENRSGRLRRMDGGQHDEPTLAARTLQNLGVPNPPHQIRPGVVPSAEFRSRLPCLPCSRTLCANGADAARTRRRRGENDIGPGPCGRSEHAVVDHRTLTLRNSTLANGAGRGVHNQGLGTAVLAHAIVFGTPSATLPG